MNTCTECGNKDNYNFALNIGLCNPCIGKLIGKLEDENKRLQEENRWILVGERLPEEGQYSGLSERVHTLNLNQQTFMVDRWAIDKKWWTSGRTTHTHWRPITLPKGELK